MVEFKPLQCFSCSHLLFRMTREEYNSYMVISFNKALTQLLLTFTDEFIYIMPVRKMTVHFNEYYIMFLVKRVCNLVSRKRCSSFINNLYSSKNARKSHRRQECD